VGGGDIADKVIGWVVRHGEIKTLHKRARRGAGEVILNVVKRCQEANSNFSIVIHFKYVDKKLLVNEIISKSFAVFTKSSLDQFQQRFGHSAVSNSFR
jgi:hypothetical protein